jgi:hypothetical protein
LIHWLQNRDCFNGPATSRGDLPTPAPAAYQG